MSAPDPLDEVYAMIRRGYVWGAIMIWLVVCLFFIGWALYRLSATVELPRICVQVAGEERCPQ